MHFIVLMSPSIVTDNIINGMHTDAQAGMQIPTKTRTHCLHSEFVSYLSEVLERHVGVSLHGCGEEVPLVGLVLVLPLEVRQTHHLHTHTQSQ